MLNSLSQAEEKEPLSGPGRANGAEGRGEIFRDLGNQMRREAARSVGLDADADWTTIGRQTNAATRRNVARAVGLGEDADWEEIGLHLERSTRSGIARLVGTSTGADWATIGQTVATRVRAFFDDLFERKAESASPSENDRVDPWK